jgi:hypothetical protein
MVKQVGSVEVLVVSEGKVHSVVGRDRPILVISSICSVDVEAHSVGRVKVLDSNLKK